MIALLLGALLLADVEERVGARVPLDLPFTDEQGRSVALGDSFRDGKPVVLVLAYYRCPMLCDLVLAGVGAALARQGLELGRDFHAVTVSFDPRDRPDEAARKRAHVLAEMHATDRDWPFLVGAERNVRALADRLGFRYSYDAKTDQYAHPAVAFVLTSDGRVARYLYGFTFRPLDLRLALDEAARGRIGGTFDRVLLTCFRWDPAKRRYGMYIAGGLRAGGALVLALVAGGLALLWRNERRRRA